MKSLLVPLTLLPMMAGNAWCQDEEQTDWTIRMQQFFDHHLKGQKDNGVADCNWDASDPL